jgi:[acyl-carrier-protein] S-malonyltransferase
MLDLAASTAAGADVIRRASAAAGRDLAALARAGGPETYRNAVAQPLLCAVELATWAALRDHLPRPALFLGYSLGELAAYGCAGALEPAELVALAGVRAALMDGAASARRGGLVAVRGLPLARVEALARAAGAEIAIVNAADQLIVGGSEAALPALARSAEAAGAKVQRLCVDVPAHTSALRAAVAPFADALAASPLRDPRVWDGQAARFQHLIVIKENIQIDQARAILKTRLAAQLVFKPLKKRKQLFRRKARRRLDDLVEESRLVGITPGRGFINR